jgi:nuclear pore complex protein Nup133
VTDSELNDKYRRTALYAALRAAPKYIVEPQHALGIPSIAEISSRWPGMPPDQVEAVEGDYRIESERLKLLGLEHDFARVAELAAGDDME